MPVMQFIVAWTISGIGSENSATGYWPTPSESCLSEGCSIGSIHSTSTWRGVNRLEKKKKKGDRHQQCVYRLRPKVDAEVLHMDKA